MTMVSLNRVGLITSPVSGTGRVSTVVCLRVPNFSFCAPPDHRGRTEDNDS